MALARQCDRCGTTYPNKKPELYTYHIVQLRQNQHADIEMDLLDLCPGCQDKLKQFMRDGGLVK